MNYKSHRCCFEAKMPPCGLPGKHRCCICTATPVGIFNSPTDTPVSWEKSEVGGIVCQCGNPICIDRINDYWIAKVQAAEKRGREEAVKVLHVGTIGEMEFIREKIYGKSKMGIAFEDGVRYARNKLQECKGKLLTPQEDNQ